MRTLVWAVALGAVAWLSARPLDALGRVLLLPPSYRPGVRVFLACLWLMGVAAVWSYRPTSHGKDADDGDR